MADWQQIECDIWTDKNFQGYSPHEKLIFVYLLTNAQTSESGIYEVTFTTIHNATGVPKEEVASILTEGHLENIMYDEDASCVWIMKYRERKRGGNPVWVNRAVAKDYMKTRNSILWKLYRETYREDKHLLQDVLKPFVRKPKKPPADTSDKPLTPRQLIILDILKTHVNNVKHKIYPGIDLGEEATARSWVKEHEKRVNNCLKKIKDVLKKDIPEGVELLKQRSLHISQSEWHNGGNPDGKIYLAIENAFRPRLIVEDVGNMAAADNGQPDKREDYQKDILFDEEETDEQA